MVFVVLCPTIILKTEIRYVVPAQLIILLGNLFAAGKNLLPVNCSATQAGSQTFASHAIFGIIFGGIFFYHFLVCLSKFNQMFLLLLALTVS